MLTRRARRAMQGFTLVELVVAMTLAVIVVGFMSLFFVGPVNAYQGQTRRAELVDSADNVLREIARDVHSALPNSVRVSTSGNVTALALIPTIDAVRYRDTDSVTSPADELDFSTADTSFSTLGKFAGITRPYTAPANAALVIYNVGIPGADAYDAASVVRTPAATIITITDGAVAGEDSVTLTPGFQFGFASPAQRVFLTSGPITYLCNTTTGTLTKYTGHSVASALSTNAAALTGDGATAAAVANDISACGINYAAGTAHRAALVSLSVVVTRNGESVRLLHQVHVENAP